MTEAAYQEARKVMNRANWLRGQITTRKGEVAKWTNIEDSHRRNLKEAQAEGAKKMLLRAIDKLNESRQKFSELQLPDNNLIEM